MIVLNPEVWKCPIYVRNGGIIFSLPQMQYTTEQAWNKLTVDALSPQKELSAQHASSTKTTAYRPITGKMLSVKRWSLWQRTRTRYIL
jgi:hypothetical protein